MADFVENNFLVATDEVSLVTVSPPVRGSADWLAALSDEVNHELSDSLSRQEASKKAAGMALLALDDVIDNMRSHTRTPQAARTQHYGAVSKPSALSAYGLEMMVEVVPEVTVSSQASEPDRHNWSVLKAPSFQIPRLKLLGGHPSPSPQ